MRVLVVPHDMELGGSAINAIDLATAMRAHGHEPIVVARQGPLVDRVRERGIPLIRTDVPTRPRPWPGAVLDIRRAAARHEVDLIHTYEFWPCVEAFLGTGGVGRLPVLGTIMTMGLDPYVPRSIPLTLGYGDLVEFARQRQHARVHQLEPPIDVDADRPGIDTTEFASRFGLTGEALNVVVVSRVAHHQKLEGIERTIDAVAHLARTLPVRLLLVGGGRALPTARARAAAVNEGLGRDVVVTIGPLADPRPAYEIADVVVGMGSSAMRGMAFGKPVVVVGVEGFSAPVRPETMATFDRTGFYGTGQGRPVGPDPLVEQIGELLTDASRRVELGAYGRTTVVSRFSLTATAARLDAIYRDVAGTPVLRGARVLDLAATSGRIVRFKVSRRAG
jgi:glycosyltransferase involved in cell wall biosynthesis